MEMSEEEFCNISNEVDYQSEEECKISECASASSEDIERAGFNSDDDVENTEITIKATNSGLYHQRGSAKRKRLPLLAVKRKSLILDGDEEAGPCSSHAISSVRDSSKVKPLKSHSNISPWQKVRSVFAPLQRSSISITEEEMTTRRERDLNGRQIVTYYSDSDQEPLPHSLRQSSQFIEMSTQEPSQESYHPSELDLLVALLKRDNATAPAKVKQRTKWSCAKDSYLYQVQCTLESARTDRKFLEHDKKFGLLSGLELRVLQLSVSFGVHLATAVIEEKEQQQTTTTERDDIDKKLIYLVLNADMARQVKVGSTLEAFFNPDVLPYMVHMEDGVEKSIYVQPNKLLLLSKN